MKFEAVNFANVILGRSEGNQYFPKNDTIIIIRIPMQIRWQNFFAQKCHISSIFLPSPPPPHPPPSHCPKISFSKFNSSFILLAKWNYYQSKYCQISNNSKLVLTNEFQLYFVVPLRLEHFQRIKKQRRNF